MRKPINLTVNLDKKDLQKYQFEASREKNIRASITIGAFVGPAMIGLKKLGVIFGAIYVSIFVAFYLLWKMKYRSHIRSETPSLFFKPLHFNLNSSNVKIWNDINSTNCEWSDIKEVSQDKRLIYIWLDDVTAQIIPKRQIENPEALYTQLQNWFENSRNNKHPDV